MMCYKKHMIWISHGIKGNTIALETNDRFAFKIANVEFKPVLLHFHDILFSAKVLSFHGELSQKFFFFE